MAAYIGGSEFSRDDRAVGRRPNAPGFRPIPSGES
jgi:hypothetical protein